MKRKRTRSSGWEAELREKARELRNERDIEILRTAALMLVGRRLDEIGGILRAAGYANSVGTDVRAIPSLAGANRVHQASPAPAVEHPCVQCGRESIRRTRPNKFNAQGSWYCQSHVALAAQSDFEDNRDAALLGSGTVQGPSIAKPKPALVQTHSAQMQRETVIEPDAVPETQIQPTAAKPQEAAGAASIEDAFSALGMSQ